MSKFARYFKYIREDYVKSAYNLKYHVEDIA